LEKINLFVTQKKKDEVVQIGFELLDIPNFNIEHYNDEVENIWVKSKVGFDCIDYICK
jgi:hypothetical protein